MGARPVELARPRREGPQRSGLCPLRRGPEHSPRISWASGRALAGPKDPPARATETGRDHPEERAGRGRPATRRLHETP